MAERTEELRRDIVEIFADTKHGTIHVELNTRDNADTIATRLAGQLRTFVSATFGEETVAEVSCY